MDLAAPPTQATTPSDFLKAVLGRLVVVKLNSGVTYRGNKFSNIAPSNHFRYPGLFGRLHEYCYGANPRVCQRTTQKHLCRHFHSREQWCVKFPSLVLINILVLYIRAK